MSTIVELRKIREEALSEGIPAEAWDNTLAGQQLAFLEAVHALWQRLLGLFR